jgi:O-antigen/teichoic acid export membrane protein
MLSSSGWSLAGTAVMAAYSLLLVSFLLRSLGPEHFAPWAAAVALLGYLSLLDAGLSATTTRDAAHVAAGEPTAIVRVRAANALFAGMAVGALVLGGLGALAIPAFLGLQGSAALDAHLVVAVLVVDFGIVLATAGWAGILRGYQRYDLIFLGNLTHALVGGFVMVATIGSLGMVGAALAQLAGRLASRAVLALALRRRVPWFTIRPGRPSGAILGSLWRFSLPIFALQLATQVGVGTDVIIVGAVAGATSVGLYAAGSQLVRNVAYLLLPMLSVLLPALSRASIEDALGTARQLPTLVLMAGILGAAAFGGLAAEAGPIMELWTGRQPQLSIGVLTTYALAFALITPVQVLILALIATGRHALIGAVVLLEAVLNLGLSLVLAQALGPIGVAISTLALVCIDSGLLIPVIAARRLDVPIRRVLLAIYGGIAVGFAIVIVGQVLPVEGVAGLLLRIAVCGPATLLAMTLAWRRSASGRGPRPTSAIA